MHGELDQRERDQVLVQFANRSCSVLVASDIAARGLDIKRIEAIINVEVTPDLPEQSDMARVLVRKRSGLLVSMATV